MKTDVTLTITPKMLDDAKKSEKKELEGHLGTHFDVMDKEFPLEYTERDGIIFDVSGIEREIQVSDIELDKVRPESFVLFYTGFADSEPYGSYRYFKEHPRLSNELIDALLEKGISMIGLDFAGARRGKEHFPVDQRCADKGVFIVENLCNLCQLLGKSEIKIHTYPMRIIGVTGLPCRVIAEI